MIGRTSDENNLSSEIASGDNGPYGEIVAPEVSYHFINLPKTKLHYVRAGDGPPLIMVPATISRIDNWLSLVQFMGQRFSTYFFELPGHGKSTPFLESFNTDLVAKSVEAFIDQMGFEKVSLMGFSFGGILTMKSLYLLQDRVEKLILLAPVLSRQALTYSTNRLNTMQWFAKAMQRESVRRAFLRVISNKKVSPIMASAIRRFAKVEETIPLETLFQKIQGKTLEVLTYQINELLNFELPNLPERFHQACAFAMSINDPMLDFDDTLKVAQGQFENLHVERFDYPYHQLPETPTFHQMVEQYENMLENFCKL